MTQKHSDLGASSAVQWMNCPGRNKLIEQLKETHRVVPKSSPYAELGSAAHELSEYCLSFEGNPEDWGGMTGPIKDSKGRDVVTREIFIDDNMVEAVSVYLEYVQDKMRLGGELFIETKFDLTHIHEGMFGTADAVICNPMLGVLEIIDYKHGQGIAVSPVENRQAMFYGLGALSAFDEKMQIDKIILTIVQPRAAGAPVKSWETTPEVLKSFGEELRKAALATRKNGAKLESGEWCRFCPAQALCPKIKERSMEVAKAVFNDETKIVLPDPKLLSLEQLKEVLDFSDTLSNWLKAAKGFALELAQRGTKVPGYKLVAKRADRRWKDEIDAERALIDYVVEAFPSDINARAKAFSEPKLLSPAQAEKLKLDKNLVASLTETPDTGTTLALDADRRPEVAATTAQNVFSVQDINPLD